VRRWVNHGDARGHRFYMPRGFETMPLTLRRLACYLHAFFRPCLASTPLPFAVTSPPSDCEEDFSPPSSRTCTVYNGRASLLFAVCPWLGGGFEPPPSRLCDLTHLSMTVGLIRKPTLQKSLPVFLTKSGMKFQT
jgi:hypothetical protein